MGKQYVLLWLSPGLIADINLVGGPKQKGITTYSLSSLQQRAMAGTLNGAIFNTFRRTKNQFLYFAPPFIVGYYIYTWAGER